MDILVVVLHLTLSALTLLILLDVHGGAALGGAALGGAALGGAALGGAAVGVLFTLRTASARPARTPAAGSW